MTEAETAATRLTMVQRSGEVISRNRMRQLASILSRIDDECEEQGSEQIFCLAYTTIRAISHSSHCLQYANRSFYFFGAFSYEPARVNEYMLLLRMEYTLHC